GGSHGAVLALGEVAAQAVADAVGEIHGEDEGDDDGVEPGRTPVPQRPGGHLAAWDASRCLGGQVGGHIREAYGGRARCVCTGRWWGVSDVGAAWRRA